MKDGILDLLYSTLILFFLRFHFLTLSSKLHPSLILSYSIAFGCLKAMDFQYKKTKYFNKEFNRILKKVNIKKYEKR